MLGMVRAGDMWVAGDPTCIGVVLPCSDWYPWVVGGGGAALEGETAVC